MAKALLEQLSDKILVGDGCWEWTGSKVTKGYGALRVEGKLKPAHRILYELLVGDIPEGLQIDHLCRNRACVRPDHMEPVTCQENIQRSRALITHCPQDHPYDEANTIVRVSGGRTWRICRHCAREKGREAARRYRSRRNMSGDTVRST